MPSCSSAARASATVTSDASVFGFRSITSETARCSIDSTMTRMVRARGRHAVALSRRRGGGAAPSPPRTGGRPRVPSLLGKMRGRGETCALARDSLDRGIGRVSTFGQGSGGGGGRYSWGGASRWGDVAEGEKPSDPRAAARLSACERLDRAGVSTSDRARIRRTQ